MEGKHVRVRKPIPLDLYDRIQEDDIDEAFDTDFVDMEDFHIPKPSSRTTRELDDLT